MDEGITLFCPTANLDLTPFLLLALTGDEGTKYRAAFIRDVGIANGVQALQCLSSAKTIVIALSSFYFTHLTAVHDEEEVIAWWKGYFRFKLWKKLGLEAIDEAATERMVVHFGERTLYLYYNWDFSSPSEGIKTHMDQAEIYWSNNCWVINGGVPDVPIVYTASIYMCPSASAIVTGFNEGGELMEEFIANHSPDAEFIYANYHKSFAVNFSLFSTDPLDLEAIEAAGAFH